MKPQINTLLTSLVVANSLIFGMVSAQTGTIANWKELNTSSTNSGMNTDSPTIGDGSPDNADNTWVAGRLGTVATPASVTLAIGETLTVSGSVTLTGGTNVPSNLRFGVFDESGQFASGGTTWSNGGFLLREGAGSSDGWYQARTDNVFVSTNPNAVLLTTSKTNTGGALDGDSALAYDWSISVTRDSATTVDLFGSIAGGDNAYNQTYTTNDVTTSLFTYNAVGILFGGSLDMDQAVLSGVQYSVTPPVGGNAAPVFAVDPMTGTDATEDSPYSGTLAGSATDGDGDTLTYAKVSGPAWLSVAGDGTLSGTPTNANVGANSFTVSVSDSIAPPVEATLNVTVINTNDAPTFAVELIYGNTGRVGIAYSGTLAGYASDDDGDVLTYAKVSGPTWLGVAGNGELTGTPQIVDLGSNEFTVSVTDGTAPAVEASLRILVTDTNAAPVFTSDPISGADGTENIAYSGTLAGSATDGDGDTLTYAKVSGPAWLSVAGDGGLSGTPVPGDVGANAFIVSVTDGIVASPVEATLNITVDAVVVATDITYVDAVEGAAGNTYATGGSLSDTSWINPDTGSGAVDDQWKKRSLATAGTVFQSRVDTAGLQAELTTQITGLADGPYEVWVFFWDAANGNIWNISAGLSSGSLSTYSFDGLGDTASPVAASTLAFANVPLLAEDDRILYGVKLGQATVGSGSAIEVFVNGLNTGSENRTWYDGVGYKPILDTDGDGLSDDYEQSIIDADPGDGVTSFADVMGTGAAPAVTDFDNDGSNDAEEAANGTDPLDPDSDDDDLLDGVETNTGTYVSASDTGTDPLDDDSDNDGLLDGVETNTNTYVSAGDTGTSPLASDSDGDGLDDGFEVTSGTDPNDITDPYSVPLVTPIQLAPDGVWTWFNDERSIWHLGKLYTGYVMQNGKVGISRFDPATMATTHTSLSGFTQVDDHNNPSITILPDNRLMVVYSQHNGSAFRRISNVTEPASIGEWGNEVSTNGTSYANTYRLTGESDRIYHFNRSINWDPTMHISDDDGASFGPQTHFIQTANSGTRPYPKYFSNGVDRIDLIYTDGHPRDENNSIYHLYYEGDHFRATDGTVVEAVADLPIEHFQGKTGTEVYTYSSSAWGPEDGPDDWIPSGRGWTWDICYGSDGNPVCAFQVQVDNVTGSGWNHDRIYFYYARWTGTEWQRRFIAHGGRGIYSAEDDYGGGVAIDPDNPNVIYISTNAADPFDLTDINNVPLAPNERYEIWQGTTTDGGLTFSWQPVTQGSTSDNLRPIVPANHGYDQSVVWFRGDYTTYKNYDTEVVGIFQNQLRILDAQVQPSGGDLTWASSPGKTYRIKASGDLQSFPHEAAGDIDSQGSSTNHTFSIPAALSNSPKAFFRIEEQ